MKNQKVVPISKIGTKVYYQISASFQISPYLTPCKLFMSGTMSSLSSQYIIENLELMLSYFESLPVLDGVDYLASPRRLNDSEIIGKTVIIRIQYSANKGYKFKIDVPEIVINSGCSDTVALLIRKALIDELEYVKLKPISAQIEFKNGRPCVVK